MSDETGMWARAVVDTPAPAVVEDYTPPGRLARWRLTEPVRLYLYGIVMVLIVGLQLAGYLTGEWLPYAVSSAGVVLAVGGAGEAVRASVYSPAGTVRAVRAGVAAASARR